MDCPNPNTQPTREKNGGITSMEVVAQEKQAADGLVSLRNNLFPVAGTDCKNNLPVSMSVGDCNSSIDKTNYSAIEGPPAKSQPTTTSTRRKRNRNPQVENEKARIRYKAKRDSVNGRWIDLLTPDQQKKKEPDK